MNAPTSIYRMQILLAAALAEGDMITARYVRRYLRSLGAAA